MLLGQKLKYKTRRLLRVGGLRLEVGGKDCKQHLPTSSEAILQPNAAESVRPPTSSDLPAIALAQGRRAGAML
jgi:hypothetical protein